MKYYIKLIMTGDIPGGGIDVDTYEVSQMARNAMFTLLMILTSYDDTIRSCDGEV